MDNPAYKHKTLVAKTGPRALPYKANSGIAQIKDAIGVIKCLVIFRVNIT